VFDGRCFVRLDSPIKHVWRAHAYHACLAACIHRYASHLGNLCQNLFTLRWKSVIARLCLVRPQVFRFSKNFANRQNIKDAVVLGRGRQICEKSSQTTGITALTVNGCQRNMKNDTRGKFSSSSRSFIMNGQGYYYNPAQFQGFHGFYGDSMEYPQYVPVYHDMTGRGT